MSSRSACSTRHRSACLSSASPASVATLTASPETETTDPETYASAGSGTHTFTPGEMRFDSSSAMAPSSHGDATDAGGETVSRPKTSGEPFAFESTRSTRASEGAANARVRRSAREARPSRARARDPRPGRAIRAPEMLQAREAVRGPWRRSRLGTRAFESIRKNRTCLHAERTIFAPDPYGDAVTRKEVVAARHTWRIKTFVCPSGEENRNDRQSIPRVGVRRAPRLCRTAKTPARARGARGLRAGAFVPIVASRRSWRPPRPRSWAPPGT